MENVIDATTRLVTLTKRPNEARIFDMDCIRYMRDGDTISNVSAVNVTNLGNVTGSTNVTPTGIAHDSAQTVQAKYSGGTDGEDYEVEAEITTSSGDTLRPKALLRVRD